MPTVPDTWVSRGEPGNGGRGNHLKIQRDRKDGYLKFDVREVDGGVSSATLTCTISLEDRKGAVHVHGGPQPEKRRP
jgi:hypothetical protein